MIKFAVICVSVLALLVFVDVDAKRGQGSGKGGPMSQPKNNEPPSSGQSSDMPGPDRPEDAEVSRWEETVEGAQSPIRERGWSSASEQLVKVEASGMELRNLGYASSSSLYDFSRDNDESDPRGKRAAVRTGRACYLLPVRDDVNFQSAASALADRNNTEGAIDRGYVSLDATADPLSADDVSALNDLYPALVTFCGDSPIFDAQPAQQPADDAEAAVADGTEELTVLTLDDEVTILINTPEAVQKGSGQQGNGQQGSSQGVMSRRGRGVQSNGQQRSGQYGNSQQGRSHGGVKLWWHSKQSSGQQRRRRQGNGHGNGHQGSSQGGKSQQGSGKQSSGQQESGKQAGEQKGRGHQGGGQGGLRNIGHGRRYG